MQKQTDLLSGCTPKSNFTNVNMPSQDVTRITWEKLSTGLQNTLKNLVLKHLQAATMSSILKHGLDLMLRDPYPKALANTCWIMSLDRFKRLQFHRGAPKETSNLDVPLCSPVWNAATPPPKHLKSGGSSNGESIARLLVVQKPWNLQDFLLSKKCKFLELSGSFLWVFSAREGSKTTWNFCRSSTSWRCDTR